MKKRVLSLFLAFVLCLTLLPTSVFAEGADGSAAAGASTEDNGQSANTGKSEQPNSETDTRTEIWCVGKPDSIGRGYDGTTDGSTIPIDLTFTDGTNEIKLKEGTGFTAKKTFDSADAGDHTVTVEITLIGNAATKYKLKAGEEKFEIRGAINKAYPKLTVSLSQTTCMVGEKLLPLLSISGRQENAAVTYYYTQFQSIAGYSEYEDNGVIPKIDENTAISSFDEEGNNTYYVYAKTAATQNYNENISNVVELTVNEAVVEAASVTKADGTDGGTYGSLPAALNAAQDGDTVKLLTTSKDDDTISFCRDADGKPVEKTVTLMMNGHSLSYEGTPSLNIQSGKLIIGDDAAISQPAQTAQPAVFVDNDEQSKDRGTLEFKGKATLTGGLFFQNYGKLVGGLKEGTIITSNGTYSVSVENSYTYSNVLGLLGDGLAFAKKDHPDELVNGNVKQLTEDVIVVAHTHSPKCTQNPDPDALQTYIYICDCGFVCPHDRFTNSICDICHAACTHDEYTSDDKCARCGAPFAVRVECTDSVGITSNKLYMKTTTQDGTDDTLRQVFNEAADGSTITLLANGRLPRGIYASKTLTLDLNGHSLDGYSLNVGGSTATGQALTGNLTVIDSSSGNGAVGVTVRDGGTLVFDPGNDNTTLLQLEVWGGTVKLYGGKISRSGLRLNNNITLGNLLPQKAGLAYYHGDTQLTLEEATSQTCDLVVKSCSHGGANGFDGTNCPYCNAPAVAETALNNGEGNRPWRRFADLQTALDADRGGGAEFKLLADVTGDYTINGTQDTGLDLNGHSIKGTVTVKAAAGSNTTTLSNTKNTTTASIDAVVAHRGAKLAGSGKPAVIGELTLAEGATWKDILQLPNRLGFRVTSADGTYKWYAPNDVNGSQLNNVIINSLPITTKTLNLKVDGKNLTGNSPKVERGTTVQLCASCNAKGADVYIYTGEIVGNNVPTYSQKKAEYKQIGTNWYYVVDLDANTIGTYDMYFTATKDGYSVTSSHKKLTVTKPNLSNAEITFRSSNESTYEPYRSTTTAPGFIVTYNGKTLKLGVDYTASGTASSAGVSTQTLTIKAVEGSDYTGSKTAEWRIVPHKAKVEVGDVIKAYDGTTDLPDGKISLVSAAGSAGYQAGLPLPLSEGNGFELTDAKYDSANASETEKNISFTVKLTDTNYTFEDGTTEKAFTLNGADFDDKTFQINKATVPMNNPTGTLNIINGTCQTYTYDFNNILPGLSKGKYGTISYGQADISLVSQSGYYYDETIVEFKKGKLILAQFYAKDGKMTGKIGTVKVNVTTTNYEDFQLTLVLNAVNQIKPTPDGEITAAEITYGDTLSKSEISGKMKDPNTGDAVNGTFTWTDGTIKPDANDRYEADWTFTPAAGYEKYATATGTVTIKVNKATPTFTAPPAQENLTYTGWEQALVTASSVTSGGTMQYSLTENGTYSQDIPTGTDAGAYTVWYRVIGDANHNDTAPASVAVRIGKKPLTITGVTAASKPYDGTTNAGISSVTFDNVTLNRGTDYTVAASFDDAGVGSGKNVTATVTLMEQTAKNYALEQSNFTTTGSIIKAAAPDFTKATALVIVNGHEKTYTVTLPTLPKLETPKEYGALTYEIGEIKLNDGYYTSGAKVENGELTLPIQKNDVKTTGSVGTVTVVIKSANYEDITLTVNVSAKNRITPTGTPTLSKNAIIYGDALNTIALSGKLHDNVNNVDVDGTFEWVDGTHIPVVGNGTYAAEWIFEPTDTEKYLTVSGRSNITVEKARQYGKLSMAGYTYGKTPSTPTLTDQTGDLNAQVTYSYAAADSGSVQTWDISNPPALNAGTYRMYASIGDTDNYYGFEAVHCEFVVAKATPTYTAPTGLTAKYGQTLADVKLPDGWSWMDSSESVGGASTAAKTFQAKFTPTDAVNYNMVENIGLKVMVNKADGGSLKTVELEQKYTDTSEHTYTPDWSGLPSGQTWRYNSEYSVSTGSNVTLTKQDFAANGSLLTYAVSGGKAGDKITLTLKASCDNYEDFTITLNVTLTEKDDQKPLTITGAGSVVYGQTLTLTTTGGSGTGTVTYRVDTDHSTGEATIDPNTGVLTPVKVGSVSVIATKEGDKDYNDVTSAPFVLMIKPATPTGEPKYTKITTSGKTLADAQLTVGTITPAGTISWDAGDTQSVAANTAYNWTFKPTDTVNYNNLTGSITPYTVSHSGGGGGSYNPTYAVVVDKTKNGDITASPKAATKGTIVTLTIDPDKGYELDALEILDKNGDRVKLTEKNGKYTFVMPASKVIVKGSFAAEAPEQIFFDVPVNAYYYNAVKWAADKGITGGVSPTLFDPDQPCTRAQIVTFLWRAAGSPAPKAMSAFVDVSADAYYAKAVAWAVENGITGGTGDGKFSPDATCTRAQAVTFLYRASGSPAVSGSAAFSDVATDAYYASAVKWAEKNGITGGIGNGLFGSGDNCTRAQIVTFLYRAFNK